MKIVYAGKNTKRRNLALEGTADVLVLTHDNWDDYTYKTTFPTVCRIGGEDVETGPIRILIEDQRTSSAFLDQLLAKGWDGIFTIPSTNYISVPHSLYFYEQIEGRLNIEAATSVAQKLRDASYFAKLKEDPEALRLIQTEGFRNSLQREPASGKAFLDGWKLFGREQIFIGNQTFNFLSAGHIRSLDLRFSSDSPLPHDVNVIVGPNGTGKSQLLLQIVKSWLQSDHVSDGISGFVDGPTDEVPGFADRPNLNQIIVVSYSPFELFPVDTRDVKALQPRMDHGVYRYFGFRGRKSSPTDNRRGSQSIILSRSFPKKSAAESLINCVADDQRYGAIRDWANKVKTMERVLGHAFDFDYAAISVRRSENAAQFYSETLFIDPTHVDGETSDEDGAVATPVRYIPIASDRISSLKVEILREHVRDASGVVFLKDEKPLHLSSGQRLFSYIVINILGAIRRNSLLLIDEPELFLHPNLEIEFIRMLKTILANYACKALLATHSLVSVREIPSECVHVFEMTKDGLVIKSPPFETFGGDVQRISSYVFGDKSISKPYEEWLQSQLKELGSAEALLEKLGSNINEELLIQIRAMGQDRW